MRGGVRNGIDIARKKLYELWVRVPFVGSDIPRGTVFLKVTYHQGDFVSVHVTVISAEPAVCQ